MKHLDEVKTKTGTKGKKNEGSDMQNAISANDKIRKWVRRLKFNIILDIPYGKN